jgi:hypothetical protein
LSTGGIALALAMLARGHGISLRRQSGPRKVRWGWALGGWLVAAWQMTLGFGLGLGLALSVMIDMGTRFPGGGRYTYLLLCHYLPAWDAMRTPGRLVIWTTLLLGLLAAGAVSTFGAHLRQPAAVGLPLRFALVVPLLLVLIEGWNRIPHPVIPTVPVALREAQGPVLLLPSDQLSDQVTM